jgi:hypothetical protein
LSGGSSEKKPKKSKIHRAGTERVLCGLGGRGEEKETTETRGSRPRKQKHRKSTSNFSTQKRPVPYAISYSHHQPVTSKKGEEGDFFFLSINTLEVSLNKKDPVHYFPVAALFHP